MDAGERFGFHFDGTYGIGVTIAPGTHTLSITADGDGDGTLETPSAASLYTYTAN